MAQPSKLLLKLSRRLFSQVAEQGAFVDALITPQPYGPALVWTRPRPESLPFEPLPPLPWQPQVCDRYAAEVRPGNHSLHDAGYYYCLDFSSVFAATVLTAVPQPVNAALDLCAAPGGKSLMVRQLLQPAQLWCNEVIRKRVRILIANLKRCGAYEAQVLNQDVAVLAAEMPQSASVVVVDAPCSGQSLLAKGGKAEGCFHPVNLNKNANRQKRILANAAQTVAGGGYLAYMTCTFASEENEQVCDWFLKKFPQFQPVAVPALADFQSHLSDRYCYRLWPQSGLGAGAFTCLFQNTAADSRPINQEFLQAQGRVLYPDDAKSDAEGHVADS